MALLISTNMYKAEEFKRVLPYVEKWRGQVGVEVFPMFHLCPADAMITDTKRFNHGEEHRVYPFSIIYPLRGHCYIFLKCTIALASHGLVIHAGIYNSIFTGITVSAIEVRITCYNHSRTQTLFVILICLNDFRGKFMAGNPWIIEVRKSPLV